MSATTHDPTRDSIPTVDDLEAIAARRRPPGTLPAWMDHRVWPIGFVLAIQVARERRQRRLLRRLLAEARAVLRADAAGRTVAATRLIEGLRDAYDDDCIIIAHEPDSRPWFEEAVVDGVLDTDRAADLMRERTGEPVLDLTPLLRAHGLITPLVWRSRSRADPRRRGPPSRESAF